MLFIHHTLGVGDFIHNFPSVVKSINSSEDILARNELQCRKDLGERKRIQLWSRGHVFLVRPCGHIDLWRTIYRYVN